MALMNSILSHWKMIVEVLILWFVFYRIMVFLKDTKAANVLKGIIILVVTFFIFQQLGLDTLNWILTNIFGISIIALFVLFQPELRQGLTKIGQQQFFSTGTKDEEIELFVTQISSAVTALAKKQIGALIAVQRNVGLRNYVESGILLDADISSELLQSIFAPASPLHDGGVVLVNNKIAAAGCLFPLSENPDIDKALGMRHRAAAGISEETDAVVVVVSEETGNISLAVNGRITGNLTKEDIILILKGLLKKGKSR